jgi:hypothetical protein
VLVRVKIERRSEVYSAHNYVPRLGVVCSVTSTLTGIIGQLHTTVIFTPEKDHGRELNPDFSVFHPVV